ncbi:hypothetical protein ACFFHJ_39490 [Planotetraspora thailandica]|nr:hypothetical protein [Planotetraspora thailandica]
MTTASYAQPMELSAMYVFITVSSPAGDEGTTPRTGTSAGRGGRVPLIGPGAAIDRFPGLSSGV